MYQIILGLVKAGWLTAIVGLVPTIIALAAAWFARVQAKAAKKQANAANDQARAAMDQIELVREQLRVTASSAETAAKQAEAYAGAQSAIACATRFLLCTTVASVPGKSATSCTSRMGAAGTRAGMGVSTISLATFPLRRYQPQGRQLVRRMLCPVTRCPARGIAVPGPAKRPPAAAAVWNSGWPTSGHRIRQPGR